MLFVGWQDQEWYIGDLSNSFCVALYQDEVAWFAEIEKKNIFDDLRLFWPPPPSQVPDFWGVKELLRWLAGVASLLFLSLSLSIYIYND